MKTTKTTFKLTALLLALAMLFCMIPFSAVALENDAATTESAQGISASPSQGESSAEEILGESAPKEALGLGELTTEVLATMEVNAEDIPEVIPMARAQEKGLVNRLYAQEESLSTVLFQTKSGNKTAYVFGKPVKYVDASGAVRDKSTAITGMLDITYAYAMLDNSVKVYFPRSITNGVMLSYNDYSITMKPEVSGSYTAFYAQEENAVTYAGVFGERTILSYTPTLYGVKEDIILVSYTGKSSFDFIMEQEGLTAVQNDGGWQFLNAADQVVAGLGNVVVKDSAGKTAYGELNVEALGNGQYRVTVIAPEAFLTAEDTVYPVYVDPTITIEDKEEREYYDDEGYFTDGEIDTIIDVGLYQTSADYNRAVNYQTEHYLGQYNGNGRIIYKFYDFYSDDGEFTHLSSGQIGRVTMYLSSYDEPSQNVLVRPMTATWDASIYGDNPIALLNSSVNLWNSVSGVGMSSFDTNGCSILEVDVTQIAKGWADYNRGVSSEPYNNPANGFCLSADNIYYSYIMATEGDTVYYEIEYGNFSGDYYLISKAHGDIYEFYMPYMEEEDDYLLSSYPYEDISDLDDARWTFECCGDDLYYIRLASDPTCVLYGCGTSIFATQLVEGNPYHQWEIIQSGLNCYIKNKGDQKYLCYRSMGSYYAYQLSATAYGTPEARWELLDADIFTPLTDISLDSEWLEAGKTKNFNVVASPANASHTSDMYFTWELSNSDFTVDTSGRITANTYAGDYSYLTLTHKYTGVSETFLIVTDLDIAGTGYFRSKESNLYLEISGNSDSRGAVVQVGPYSGDLYEKWILTKNNDRTYTISSAATGLFFQYFYNNGLQFVQDQYNPTRCLWKVVVCDSGDLRIISVGYENETLSTSTVVSSLGIGTIEKEAYVANITEWCFYVPQYEFNVNHYYDWGFQVRFSTDNETAKSLIMKYQNIVSERFLRIFGLDIFSEYQMFQSSADECKIHTYGAVTLSNLISSCIHYSKSHLTTTDLRNSSHDGTTTLTVALWTGHILTDNPSSNSNSSRFSIVLTPKHTTTEKKENEEVVDYLNKSNYEIQKESVFTLMHELSHQLGAPDHYCYNVDDEEAPCDNPHCDECVYGYENARACIMSWRYDISTLSDEELYCADCLDAIKNHLSNHH